MNVWIRYQIRYASPYERDHIVMNFEFLLQIPGTYATFYRNILLVVKIIYVMIIRFKRNILRHKMFPTQVHKIFLSVIDNNSSDLVSVRRGLLRKI